MAVNVNDSTFDSEVLKSDKTTVVDFFATWCGPCRMLSPVLDELSEEHPEIKLCKVDIDRSPELTERFKITSVPTVLFFKGGEVKHKSVGYVDKDDLAALID